MSHRTYCAATAEPAGPHEACSSSAGPFGHPALARHRRIKGVTLIRLTDPVRCHVRVAIFARI
jgi:hypothetical protein